MDWRILDANGKELKSPDLTAGYLNLEEVGGEVIARYKLLTAAEKNAPRIEELKRMLAETDYVAVKIAEGAATKEEYAETIANRAAWRAEINDLEG